MSFFIRNATDQGSPIDVAGYLLEDAQIKLEQEFERGAFNPVYDELAMTFDNSDDAFFGYFASTTARTEWRLMVYAPDSQRLIYEGYFTIANVKYLLETENVSIQTWHITKAFWEKAKSVVVNRNAPRDGEQLNEWTTVEYFLNRQLKRSYFKPFYFDSVDYGIYADRAIRGWLYDSTAASLRGTARMVDYTMTVAEILEAFEKYYNAVFTVNPETRTLVMLPRLGIIQDTQTDVTSTMLLDDTEVTVVPVDSKKVDYVYTFFQIPPPGRPSFVSSTQSTPTPPLATNGTGFDAGKYRYKMTYVLASTDGEEASEIETPGGDYLELVLVPDTAGDRFSVVLYLPASDNSTAANILQRRLYRTRVNEENEYYLIESISGNTGGNITDNYNDNAFNNHRDLSSGEKYTDNPKQYQVNLNIAHGLATAGGYVTLSGHTVNGIDVSGHYKILDTLGGVSSSAMIIDLDVSASKYGTGEGTGGSIDFNIRQIIPADNAAVKCWIRWNDSTGLWADPVYDIPGVTPPAGLIFDVQPVMRFMTSETDVRPLEYDVRDILNFFGAESNMTLIQDQWREMMQTLRRASFQVDGTSYRLGDTLNCDFIRASLTRNRTMRIVKCTNDFITETTQIEALV
jgi:hypothetical protein